MQCSFTERSAAVIEDSLATMQCRVARDHVVGDHTISIGELAAVRLTPDDNPLLNSKCECGRLAQHGNQP